MRTKAALIIGGTILAALLAALTFALVHPYYL